MIIKAEFRAIEGNSNQYELSFSSEFPVERWFGQEILLHDAGAVDLSRLLAVGTVLFSHGRDSRYGKVPVARIDSARLDAADKKCRAIITFDADEDSQLIKAKIDSGSIRGVSFGYGVDSWEEVMPGKTSSNGRFIGPAQIGLKWYPFEISIEPIPADPSVGVGRELTETDPATGRSENTNNQRGDDPMFGKELSQPFMIPDGAGGSGEGQERTLPTQTPPVANTEEATRAAVTLERQRVSEINALCRDFEVDPTEHIDSGASIESVRTLILEKMKTERKASPAPGDTRVLNEETDKIREAVSDALLLRGGIMVEKPADGARDFRGMSLRDVAIECLTRSGRTNAHRMDNDQLLREAITPDSQFSSILSSTVNKSMATAYKGQNTTFQFWAGRGSNPDFKGATVYQISEAGELTEMTQSGEFKSDEMQDRGVTKSIATFGKKFGINRKAIINDDLGVITKIPAAYVRAAARGINKLVYKKLTASNWTDAKALFHADHKNLGTAGGISVTTAGEARKLMRTQQNLRGKETLNISPSFLIVPAAKETVSQQFLVSVADPASTNANVANPFRNSLTLVVDAELDAISEDAYYFAANPADIDTIEVTYLNGDDMPKLESQIGFDFLGVEWRIYIDYGVNVLDYKGLVKNAGK